MNDAQIPNFSDGSSSQRLRKDTNTTEFSVRSCDFMVDNKCVAGFSDDKSVNIWDIATEEVVASWEVHKVRDAKRRTILPTIISRIWSM